MQTLPQERPSALWNRLSLAMTVLGVIFGGLIYSGKLSGGHCGEWGLACFVNGILAFSGLCSLGFIAAITAYIRREQMPAITWIGLILNGLVVLALLVVIVLILLK
jgi:hypothetical protein